MRLLFFAALFGVLSGCCGLPVDSPTEEPPSKPVPKIRTDLEGLQRRITLPPEVTEVRWLAAPRGVQGGLVPGPTDYEIVARMPLEAAQTWTLRERWGSVKGSPPSLPAPQARALLGKTEPKGEALWTVAGEHLSEDKLEVRGGFHVAWVVLTTDALWVMLYTM